MVESVETREVGDTTGQLWDPSGQHFCVLPSVAS